MKSLLKRIASIVVPSWSPRLHALKSRAVYRAIAPVEGYHSQYGQDQFLDNEVFRGQRGGVFVDVGANDGVSFSNTLLLERERGWRGLCIEPHPRAFEQLVRNRTCDCFNGTMGAEKGVGRFLQLEGYCEMLSGLVDEYSQDHLDRVERDLALHG
ncbi:MAG: FkbM family methyltransferase, partial [Acidimicrobiales bacterium]